MPLIVLHIPLNAHAQVPCVEPLVQVNYEADTLPQDDPTAPWVANVTGDVLAFVAGGVLTVVSQADSQVIYDRCEDGMAGSNAYAFSARFWLESTQPGASRAGIVLGGKDGTKSPRIILFDWPDYGRRFLRLETLSWPPPEVELDWSEPHAYRFEVIRDGLVRVYVDGNLIIEHPYADLTDCLPGEGSFGLSSFGMAESTVRWDWVRYEFCPAVQGPEVPPPLETQLARMQAEVAELDAPLHVRQWLLAQLALVGVETDPAVQAELLLGIGRHLFVFRRTGSVGGDVERLETLIDFGRESLVPATSRDEGYIGRLEILGALYKNPVFTSYGDQALIRLFVSLSPAAIQALGQPDRRFGLLARAGLVRVSTGEVAFLGATLQPFEREISRGPASRVEEVDITWDGTLEGGGTALAGHDYFFDAVVELVELDPATGSLLGPIDQVATWRDTTLGIPPLAHELWSLKRSIDLRATRIATEYLAIPKSEGGDLFFTTIGASGSIDPVMEVLEAVTNARLAGADDCPEGMPDWIPVYLDGVPGRWYGTVRCVARDGGSMPCPDVRTTANACLSIRIQDENPRRFVLHGAANGSEGLVMVTAWRRSYSLLGGSPQITYRQVFSRDDVSAGGTFVRIIAQATDEEELEVLAPSPERCEKLDPGQQGDCYPSGAGMSAYLMASHDTIADARAHGNGLAGGARLSAIPAGMMRPLFLVGSSDAPGSSSKRFGLAVILNDVGTALERDQDGLSELLEADLRTDPDNPDTDGDGIWDGFELLGIRAVRPYRDQALPTWGADPRHKDVFVENDVYCDDIEDDSTCWAPFQPDAIEAAAKIALSCPGGSEYLANPDGRPGFSVHVDNGMPDTSGSRHGDWGGAGELPWISGAPAAAWEEEEHFSAIRRGIFRYGASSSDNTASVGQPVFESSPISGSVLVHEIGHTLGADHWGRNEPGSNYNDKPHYVSLMNYSYDDGSPTSDYDAGDSRHFHDSTNVRFSLGQYRNALDADGNLVPFALDSADIREGYAFPMITTERSDTLTDLEGAPFYFRDSLVTVQGLQAVRVDWDRSGSLDLDLPAGSMARSDVVREFNPFTTNDTGSPFRYVVYEGEPVRFGPQLAVRGDRLYMFSVPEGSDAIRYRAWIEPPPCDPEDSALPAYCGQEIESGDIVGDSGVTGISSEMSAVSVPEGPEPEDDRLFLFYRGSGALLCVLHLGENGWEGPECRAHGASGAPEAVRYQGKLLAFVPGPPDAQEMMTIRAVVIDPDSWRDPGVPWSEKEILVDAGQGPLPMRSKHTPGLSEDPGDGSLVGVMVDEDGMMDAVVGAPALDESSFSFSRLAEETWRSHPRVGVVQKRYADFRPAILAERTASGQQRWTVWAYSLAHYPEVPGLRYQRITTTREGDDCLADPSRCRVSFSRYSDVAGPPRPSGLDHPSWLKSMEKRNVSIVAWRGKLRAAAAYDAWTRPIPPHGFDPYHEPGFIFFPVGDGVTHQALRDVNDCDTFKQLMASSLTFVGKEPFFQGMDEITRATIEALNRVRLPREPREVESFFLCPGCPPIPRDALCGGGASP